MTEQPFLSVITVSFNSAATIGDTLKSLQEQSCSDYESIVIDGGSKDDTELVVKKYEGVVDVFISEEDRGIYDAMNKGLDRAKGKYVAFLNSDDAYLPDTIALVRNFFEKTTASIVYGNILKERILGSEVLQRLDKPSLEKMPETMGVFHPATFIKHDLFERFGKYDLRFSQASDYHWLLRAFLQGAEFAYLDAPLAKFRVGGVSNSSCESYREAAIIQREFNTGFQEKMDLLYAKCLGKQRRNKLAARLAEWPLFKSIYRQKVKKRWS